MYASKYASQIEKWSVSAVLHIKLETNRFEGCVKFLGDLEGVAGSALEVVGEKRGGGRDGLKHSVYLLAQLTKK